MGSMGCFLSCIYVHQIYLLQFPIFTNNLNLYFIDENTKAQDNSSKYYGFHN